MSIEEVSGKFIIRFLGTERKTMICNSLRGMVETVVGYFVPSAEARRWHVVIDDPPNEVGEQP